jgi:ABC-2 type transport system permease protein
MKRLKRNSLAISSMTIAFTKRYFRDKVALFFTFLFPIVFLLIFGSIFGGSDGPSFNVVLINNANSEFSSEFIESAKEGSLFTFEESVSFEVAEEQLGRGEIDGIIILPEDFGVVGESNYPEGTLNLFYDQGDEQLALTLQAVIQGSFDAINQELAPAAKPFTLNAQPIQTADLSRFDYTLAGLIGFSLLSLGIFSMSEGFTGDKKAGALRRMQVSPIKVWQLVTATAINRVFIGIISVALMFIVALVVFDFNMRGDYISLVLFTIISTICLFGFGMAIAGWAKDANQAAPLSNLVSFPMMFLSGVFFPVFLMPELLQKITFFIPLTPVVDGLRLIMTEGYTLLELGPQLAVIGAWTVIIYLIAFRVFRWE